MSKLAASHWHQTDNRHAKRKLIGEERKVSDIPIDAWKVAYDQGQRAVSQQVSTVDQIRSRAGVLVSVGSGATGFLGKEAVTSGNVLALWVGLGMYIAFAIASLKVLWPSSGWSFSLNSKKYVNGFLQRHDPYELADIYRILGEQMQDDWEANDHKLGNMYEWFKFASVFLVFEIAAFLVALLAGR